MDEFVTLDTTVAEDSCIFDTENEWWEDEY